MHALCPACRSCTKEKSCSICSAFTPDNWRLVAKHRQTAPQKSSFKVLTHEHSPSQAPSKKKTPTTHHTTKGARKPGTKLVERNEKSATQEGPTTVGLAVVASVSLPWVAGALVKSAENPGQHKGTTLDVVAESSTVTEQSGQLVRVVERHPEQEGSTEPLLDLTSPVAHPDGRNAL